MVLTNAYRFEFKFFIAAIGWLFLAFSIFSIGSPLFAQANLSQPDNKTLIINDAPDIEVFSMGKTVIIKNRVKGVLSLGGDVIVEGKVTEDVATIGGSVIQKRNAFIGGDVIILGGRYQHEADHPLRNERKQTVMYAGYEEELRNYVQNPWSLFSPDLSWGYLIWRLSSVFFWFIISLGLTTIAPGAISRSVARIQLSTLKVFGIGALGMIVTTLVVMLSLEFLPSFVGVVVGLMSFVLIMLAYVFGRVVIQVSLGKWIVKKLLSNRTQSESLTLVVGALVSTLLLSIPYLKPLVLFLLFMASLGLILTAKSKTTWRES